TAEPSKEICMGDVPSEKIIVKNIMEELVEEKLDMMMSSAGVCDCEQCRADVFAYALNHLPPKYIASTSGDVFTRVNTATTQFQADILTAIVQAIDMVSKHPRHPVVESK
ncbi:MAG: late competence development ComFB family protein, partial [Christensenellaceae bacterium]